jgi:hypothetical protein
MAVPETTVNEYDGSVSWEHHIGPSGQISCMNSEAKAQGVKSLPQNKLRLCVLAANP